MAWYRKTPQIFVFWLVRWCAFLYLEVNLALHRGKILF